ncbi:hypothetical protein ABZ070_10120 [Streptomyces sp. NPDC006283]|uniref:hypothetical protein n=1 Tax=Streptomyces sp. NPDC006283 TaxID=3156741 RepID=UPI0033A8572D
MKIRADVAELLRAGLPDRAIARQLHVDHKGVSKARAALGLPKAKPGLRAAGSAEDLFWRRVQLVEGGHMLWTGSVSNDGCPGMRHGGKHMSAYRIAFKIRHKREPVGKVTSACDRELCVSPHCVEDRVIRQRTEATYAAIFGAAG